MPLVLHNVPDDELYVGKDGVTRPFAVVGPVDERRSARLRRQASASHGAFGRTRSRPRTGTAGPGGSAAARGKQQQGKTATTTTTTMAADEMFGMWKKEQEMLSHGHQQHQQQQQHLHTNGGDAQAGQSQDDLLDHRGPSSSNERASRKVSSGSALSEEVDTAPAPTQQSSFFQKPQNQPTEVILRGYRSADYQYAALNHYEQIAGRICEDYPRDPPVGSRRYRSSLRDGAARTAATLASNGRPALTPAERQAVMQRAASGQHWVKVTFESAQAAEAALHASPQVVLGYLVTAELYRGVPLSPAEDVAIPDPDAMYEYGYEADGGGPFGLGGRGLGRGRGFRDGSAFSGASSRTVDSGTVTDDPFSNRPGGGGGSSSGTRAGSTTSSVRTIPGGLGRRQPWGEDVEEDDDAPPETQKTETPPQENTEFCRRIPTARRATLKAPELALLPRESALKRFVQRLPLLNRLTGTIIGNQVPRRDNGLFDWDKASLYWKLIWWLDFLFTLFGGEILDANKEE